MENTVFWHTIITHVLENTVFDTLIIPDILEKLFSKHQYPWLQWGLKEHQELVF